MIKDKIVIFAWGVALAVMLSLAVGITMSGCALITNMTHKSPEAQIVIGANAVKTAATLATVLLRNDKITVVQAKGYSSILHTAGNHLDDSATTLAACRKATGSVQSTKPDPCTSVNADIALAVSVVGDVQKILTSKE